MHANVQDLLLLAHSKGRGEKSRDIQLLLLPYIVMWL